jgi:excisionase family DNA binding protein
MLDVDPLLAERLLDATEVAALLGVPKSWVYAETRAGRLPHVTVGRYRRYRRDALNEWISEHERGPIRDARRRVRGEGSAVASYDRGNR